MCREFAVPRKNLLRWKRVGPERKQGGGRRKLDQGLESALYDWCLQEGIRIGRPVSRAQIKAKAIEICAHPDKFRASKGWVDKFVKKFKVRKTVTDRLKSMGVYPAKRRQKQSQSNSFMRQIKTEQERVDGWGSDLFIKNEEVFMDD